MDNLSLAVSHWFDATHDSAFKQYFCPDATHDSGFKQKFCPTSSIVIVDESVAGNGVLCLLTPSQKFMYYKMFLIKC